MITKRTYDEVPLPKSDYGRELYERGRLLVERDHVRPEQLVWDADEVLWDWLIDMRELMRGLKGLIRRDLTHREYFRVKAGVFELIWGLHHAAIEAGLDPYLRVWTDGYPWRMWRISQEIPGLGDLLGPHEGETPTTPEHFYRHPRLFCRMDFAMAISAVIAIYQMDPDMSLFSPAVSAAFRRHLAESPWDSTLKVPELAGFCDKDGFAASSILIDNQPLNVRRFVATERRGVHVLSETPHIFFGAVPNAVWSEAGAELVRLACPVARAIAEGLALLANGSAEPVAEARAREEMPAYEALEFAFEVPDDKVRSEWLEPLRRAKKATPDGSFRRKLKKG